MSKIFIVFFAGLAVSFSPCVFPLIPVTLGVIGAKSGCSRRRAVVISLVYVLGIAITYSLFGVLAAASGRILGSLINHDILYFFAGNICLLMGLSMFGVFNLRLPVFFSRGFPAGGDNRNRRDLFQVLCLGLFSGLIIGPCVGPVLAGILALVGVEGRMFYGALLLFVFAWGMGVSLVMAGAFSGLVNRMFSSSLRLEWVKKIWGGILIFAAEYFFIKMGGI